MVPISIKVRVSIALKGYSFPFHRSVVSFRYFSNHFQASQWLTSGLAISHEPTKNTYSMG